MNLGRTNLGSANLGGVESVEATAAVGLSSALGSINLGEATLGYPVAATLETSTPATDEQTEWVDARPSSSAFSNADRDNWSSGRSSDRLPFIVLPTDYITGSAGIASAEAFGTTDASVAVFNPPQNVDGVSGIASASALGTDGIVEFTPQTITGSAGIASESALGDGVVIGPQYVDGVSGIASSGAIDGVGVITGPIIGTVGIASASALGADGMVASGTLTGEAGIPSEEDFGTDGTMGGSVSGPLVGVSGVDSASAFGLGIITGPLSGVEGIVSAETFGTDGDLKTKFSGDGFAIPSAETFGAGGTLTRSSEGIAGIVSAEAFGLSGTLLSFSTAANGGVSNFALYVRGALQSQYLAADSLKVDRQVNFQSAAQFEIHDEASAFMPAIGDEVIAYYFDEDIPVSKPGSNTWDRIFAGTVESVSISGEYVGDPYRKISVSCIDYGRSLSKRVLNRKYLAADYGTLNSIMTDLASTVLFEEGISWVPVTDPGIAIGDIEFAYIPMNEVMDSLAELIGGCWMVDFHRNLYLSPTPTVLTSAPFDIVQDTTGLNAYMWEDLRVSRNRGLFRNRQYVRSASASSTDGAPTSKTVKGKLVTETYTFPTWHTDRNKAFHFQHTTEPENSIRAIVQDDVQFWATPAPQMCPTVSDATYNGRVYAVKSLVWNGNAQSVTKTSTPAVPGSWAWNDDNSWTTGGASRLRNAEVFMTKRIDDPHNASPTLPVDGDTVTITWVLDSLTGTEVTRTYTFPTFTGALLPVANVLAMKESDLTAVYLMPMVYWPEIHDYRYDAKKVLSVYKVMHNGVEESVGSNPVTTAVDWIWSGGGSLVSTNRHSWLTGDPPVGKQPNNGDTVTITWELDEPASAQVDSTTAGAYGVDSIGIWEAVDDLPGVTDPDLIQQYTTAMLEKFNVFGVEVEFNTLRYGFAPGQETTVTLPKYGVAAMVANVESISYQEEGMRVLRQRVKVSNQIQQRDALSAFNRLVKKLRRPEKQVKSTITFHLAETIPGITNPGLITGTNLATAFIARRDVLLGDVVVYFKTPPTGASIKINIKVDGVSCLANPLEYVAGGDMLQTFTEFASAKYTIKANSVVTIDVTQVGSGQPGKDGTVVLSGWV